MTNIRKLKIQIQCKERALKTASPNTWNRVRLELKALRMALEIAREVSVQSRAERAALGLRSTSSGVSA